MRDYNNKYQLLVCILLVCCLLFALTACGDDEDNDNQAPTPEVDVREASFFAEWQNYISDDVRLVDMVMPGSHDSGTQNIGGNKTINAFAETQGQSVYDQLLCGARYFDVRVNEGYCKDAEGNGVDDALMIFHGIANYGLSFEEVLDDFVAYFEEYDNQFVVLDFQHFEDRVENRVRERIEARLSPEEYAVKTSADLSSLTMGDIRENGAKYIVVWGSSNVGETDYVFPRQSALISTYIEDYHFFGPETLIEDGFPEYWASANENKFFVLQAQLTNSMTAQGAVTGSVKDLAVLNNEPMNEYVRELADDDNAALLEKCNIVMRDYLDMDAEKQRAALSLNLAKGTVDSEYVQLFTKMTEELD